MQQSNLSLNDKPLNIFLAENIQNWVNCQGNADCAVFRQQSAEFWSGLSGMLSKMEKASEMVHIFGGVRGVYYKVQTYFATCLEKEMLKCMEPYTNSLWQMYVQCKMNKPPAY